MSQEKDKPTGPRRGGTRGAYSGRNGEAGTQGAYRGQIGGAKAKAIPTSISNGVSSGIKDTMPPKKKPAPPVGKSETDADKKKQKPKAGLQGSAQTYINYKRAQGQVRNNASPRF